MRFPCAALVLLLYLSAPAHASPDPVPAIRSITISGNTRTRTDVIRRELLFAESEPLDTALVAETARNLRRLLFLGEIRLDTLRHGPHADITVRVRDLYARAVAPLLAGDWDELTCGAVALDHNFLGREQGVRLTLEHDAAGIIPTHQRILRRRASIGASTAVCQSHPASRRRLRISGPDLAVVGRPGSVLLTDAQSATTDQ